MYIESLDLVNFLVLFPLHWLHETCSVIRILSHASETVIFLISDLRFLAFAASCKIKSLILSGKLFIYLLWLLLPNLKYIEKAVLKQENDLQEEQRFFAHCCYRNKAQPVRYSLLNVSIDTSVASFSHFSCLYLILCHGLACPQAISTSGQAHPPQSPAHMAVKGKLQHCW